MTVINTVIQNSRITHNPSLVSDRKLSIMVVKYILVLLYFLALTNPRLVFEEVQVALPETKSSDYDALAAINRNITNQNGQDHKKDSHTTTTDGRESIISTTKYDQEKNMGKDAQDISYPAQEWMFYVYIGLGLLAFFLTTVMVNAGIKRIKLTGYRPVTLHQVRQ